MKENKKQVKNKEKRKNPNKTRKKMRGTKWRIQRD
jgi:hypothetical protein